MSFEVAGFLKAQRKMAGLTQEEFADRLGCHVYTLRRYENAEREIPNDVLIRSAELLESDEVLLEHPVVQALLARWVPEFSEEVG